MENPSSVRPEISSTRLVWDVAGKPVSVLLSEEVVSRLAIAVREGFKALPRRGLETGGILIGTRKKKGGHVVVEIDDFEAIESEHAAGPSYLLSEADRNLLESRIAAHRAGGKSQSVVGFYRSHTRSGLAMTVEDGYLFSNYFRDAADVLLLIKSNEAGLPSAGFIIKEEGRVLADTPYLQFPFAAGIAALPAAVAAAEVAVVHAPLPAPRALRLPRLPRLPRRALKLAAAALAAGVTLAVVMRVPRSATSGDAVPLALHLSSMGGGVQLTWNRLAAGSSGHGILWIQDGGVDQRVELDHNQLTAGSVAYWPRTGDVNFRLELQTPGRSITESIRAIDAIRPSPFASNGPVVSATIEPPVEIPGFAIKSAAQRRSVAEAPPQPWRDRGVRTPVQLPEPPAVRTAALPPESVERLTRAIVPAKTARSGAHVEPAFRIAAEPAAGSRLARFAGHVPLVGKRYRHSGYSPPELLRESAAAPAASGTLTHPVNLDVKVYVNAAGAVDHAELLSKVPAEDRDLAAATLASSRQCKFVPARSGEEAARGVVILHYQLGATAEETGSR
jgi:hypothetical protein